MVEGGILKKRIVEPTGNEFKPIVLPKSMVNHVLLTAHDYNEHKGFDRYCIPKFCSLSIRNSLIIINGEIHY